MTTETQTYGFWVVSTGEHTCDVTTDGVSTIETAFGSGMFADEFEAFIKDKMDRNIDAFKFIANAGDFASEYEKWEEEFLAKKCLEVFVEGRDVLFLGKVYHWNTVSLPTNESFWDYANAHEDEFVARYKGDSVMKLPNVGDDIHFDGMTSKVEQVFKDTYTMKCHCYKVETRRDFGFYVGTIISFKDHKPIRKVAVAPFE